jgi:hypothetical protein
MNMVLDTIRSRFKKLNHLLQTGILMFFLHLFFLFGIGLTAIFAKLFGQRFLAHVFTNSSWQPITGSDRTEKLF